MPMLYLIFIIACVSTIRGIIRAIRERNWNDLLLSILPFPFFFSFFIGAISGGSALHDARNEYELYRAGHYYLVSHGNWTEVSRQRYLFVLISELIGFASLALTFVLCILRDRKSRHKAA